MFRIVLKDYECETFKVYQASKGSFLRLKTCLISNLRHERIETGHDKRVKWNKLGSKKKVNFDVQSIDINELKNAVSNLAVKEKTTEYIAKEQKKRFGVVSPEYKTESKFNKENRREHDRQFQRGSVNHKQNKKIKSQKCAKIEPALNVLEGTKESHSLVKPQKTAKNQNDLFITQKFIYKKNQLKKK